MIRVYRYGALAPTENLELCEEQLLLAHRYQNKLIEIERRRREAVDAILSEPPAARAADEILARHEQVLEKELQRVRDYKKAHHTARPPANRVKELRANVKAARKARRDIRKLALKEAKPKISEAMASALSEHKAARAECGVYWGSYLVIEQAMDAAKKSVTPPRFKRWRGGGTLAVQIPKGIGPDVVMGGRHQQLRIDVLPPLRDSNRARKDRRAIVHIRVQSENRKPVFAAVPIIYHRPIPDGAKVKWAKLIKKVFAHRERWELHLVLDIPSTDLKRDPQAVPLKRRVGINTGWRQLPDGSLRVATAVGGDGRTSVLELPPMFIERTELAHRLRSIRDRTTDQMRDLLMSIRKFEGCEPWFKEATEGLHLWRSPERFYRLLDTWDENRSDGDEDWHQLLVAWKEQCIHLWQWEDGQRRRLTRQRDQIFIHWANGLSAGYDLAVIGGADLAEVAKSPPDESDEAKIPAPRRNRAIAGTSYLVSRIKERLMVGVADSHNITRTCSVCGQVDDDWSPSSELVHTCSLCGEEWDQDYNAAANVLRQHANVDEGRSTAGRFHRTTGGGE